MTDPNVTYKTGFAELVAKLGRTPTAAECLPLHEEYKRAWAPAEERTPERVPVDHLSGRRLIADGEAAVSEPKPAPTLSRVSQPVAEGRRGPGGGILAACVACGQEWERPRGRGRPPVRCEPCRG